MNWLKNVCAIILLGACTATPAAPPAGPQYVTLERSGVSVTLTPAFGGRVSAFGLAGRDSVVKFDTALAEAQPDPPVDIGSAALPYQGQSLWVGPQDEWWSHQSLAPEMQGLSWPPDPTLTAATATLTRLSPYRIALEGPDSPYTGLKVRQTYELTGAGCLKVTAEAKNIRAEPVAWDLWTNIRVPGDAWVFAPVADAEAIRPGPTNDPSFQPPTPRFTDGLAYADPSMTDVTAPAREGKVFLDVTEGWMAGVMRGQAFRVSFPYLPKEQIHPAQGQVEFYFNQPAGDAAAGVIEMEVHAAYRTLQPGETMQAVTFWSVLPAAAAGLSSGGLSLLAQEIEARDPCGPVRVPSGN